MNVNCLDQIQPLPTLIKILEKSRENTKKVLLKIAWDFFFKKHRLGLGYGIEHILAFKS